MAIDSDQKSVYLKGAANVSAGSAMDGLSRFWTRQASQLSSFPKESLAPRTVRSGESIKMRIASVSFRSLGDEVVGTLFRPLSGSPAPVLIVCHGAGEFKENYFEMCEQLVERGLAALAIYMHGHGQSGGQRFHVRIDQWVADIRAAVDFLATCSEVDGQRVGAFGLSSGGTAILEAGIVEPRLKVLIGLD